jgi:hypothetical protein
MEFTLLPDTPCPTVRITFGADDSLTLTGPRSGQPLQIRVPLYAGEARQLDELLAPHASAQTGQEGLRIAVDDVGEDYATLLLDYHQDAPVQLEGYGERDGIYLDLELTGAQAALLCAALKQIPDPDADPQATPSAAANALSLQSTVLLGEELINYLLPGENPKTREEQVHAAQEAITSLFVFDVADHFVDVSDRLGTLAAHALLAALDPGSLASERRLPGQQLDRVLTAFTGPLEATINAPHRQRPAREHYQVSGKTLVVRYLHPMQQPWPSPPEHGADGAPSGQTLAIAQLAASLLTYTARLTDAPPLTTVAPGLLACCARDALSVFAENTDPSWPDYIAALIASFREVLSRALTDQPQ